VQEVPDPELAALRARVDAVNRALRDLIQERARLVWAIGGRKRVLGLPALDPARERQMLADLVREPGEGFSADELRRVLALLMRAYRRLCLDAHG
jgi:chorismate mutase